MAEVMAAAGVCRRGVELTRLQVRAVAIVRAGAATAAPAIPSTASAATMREVELGLLLLTGTFLLIALTGGNRSFLYPLVYGLVSFLVLVSERSISTIIWVVAACIVAIVLAIVFMKPGASCRNWSRVSCFGGIGHQNR